MDYETLPRTWYLKLVDDGTRVDRVRKLVAKLNKVKNCNTMPLVRVVDLIQEALMDTETERKKLKERNEAIRQIEAECECLASHA